MTTQTLILQCSLISIICLGVHAAFWEGMIFYKLGRFIHEMLWLIIGSVLFIFRSGSLADICEKTDRIASQAVKPIFDCLICMSSIWTIVVGHYFFEWGSWRNFLFPILFVAGLNTIIDTVIYRIRNGNTEL